jgi:hypothetical protein
VLGGVCDNRAPDERGCVVPAERGAPRMHARVVAIAVEARQVDPADARNAVVDHDELLMVAVERPLLGVERHVHAGAAEALSRRRERPRERA